MIQKNNRNTFTVTDPTSILLALVGLKDVSVLHYRREREFVHLGVEQLLRNQTCPKCRGSAWIKDRPEVSYVDLPVYGKPMRLTWRKHRFKCPNMACEVSSWVSADPRIAPAKGCMTTRAAKWATKQVGGGRTVKEVAAELGCDWHTVNDTVCRYGEILLAADHKRLNRTSAIGLDETSFRRLKGHRTSYVTTVCDVENHQIIDIVPSRKYVDVAGFLHGQSPEWKDRIHFGTLDMSPTYKAVFNVILPKATQVVDHFHVIKLANHTLDQVRRRVQQQQLHHRGRKHDPLYRIRRTLLIAEERLSEETSGRLASLLALGDPDGEVAITYRIKERLREFYDQTNHDNAKDMLEELIEKCLEHVMPPEVRKLGRTLKTWHSQILAYHLGHHSNGVTEAINNLIKRVKRVGYGFRNFNNYRTRVLLYAGKPHWRTLDSITIP